jgi:hypothetical protein
MAAGKPPVKIIAFGEAKSRLLAFLLPPREGQKSYSPIYCLISRLPGVASLGFSISPNDATRTGFLSVTEATTLLIRHFLLSHF